MKKEVGLWIDHRKAVLVTFENEVEATRVIKSGIEKHVRFSSGTHSKTSGNSQGSTAEDVRDRQFGNQLGSYYDEIISIIRDADSILIFGPGEAKVEFENRLKHQELGERIVGVETVDKMTDPQITAKVRDHFLR
jgi:stalled ribosome rescue protein Dom34